MKRAEDKPSALVRIAQRLAEQIPAFQMVKGPGEGNRMTNEFMRQLREEASRAFRTHCRIEPEICGNTSFTVDFYFPRERVIVEVSLGLPNPNTEFEKDILKAPYCEGDWPPSEQAGVCVSRGREAEMRSAG